MGYKPRHVVERVRALSWRARAAVVAVAAVAVMGGGVAYAATSSTATEYCVQYGHGAGASGNVVLYNWDRSACPAGTYGHADADAAGSGATAPDDDSSALSAPLSFTLKFGGATEDCTLSKASGSYAIDCGGQITSSSSAVFSASATAAANTFAVKTVGFSSTPTLTASGTLPSGVSFKDNGDGTATVSQTGTVTASEAGSYNFKITVTAGSDTATQDFTLVVTS